MAHAVLAPSAAGIWGHCSQYPWEAQKYPDTSTQQSREGDAAHWVCSDTLEQYRAGNVNANVSEYLGKTDPAGTRIDEKMVEGAAIYVEEACRLAELVGGWHNCLIEGRVFMRRIHPEHNWGTLDLAFYSPERKTIYLRDYKHGHREVDPRGNLQMCDYMEGIVEMLGLDGHAEQETYFDIGIVQPFAYNPAGPVRNWVGKLSDLRGYWNQLHFKAHEAFNNPQMCAGTWCRDCPALLTCRATTCTAYEIMERIERPVDYDKMTGRHLATFLEQLTDAQTLIKSLKEAAEEDLKHRISQGEADTGVTVQTSLGRVEWTVDPAIAIKTMAQLGIDVSKPGVITPTQAKNATPAALRPAVAEIFKSITRRPTRGAKLVKAQDSAAARAFSK